MSIEISGRAGCASGARTGGTELVAGSVAAAGARTPTLLFWFFLALAFVVVLLSLTGIYSVLAFTASAGTKGQRRIVESLGIPDARAGEAVKAVVVRQAPATARPTEADVRAYCEANMTGYKRPKVVEFRNELPKTPVGKILRRELRDKAA